jgi:pyrroline-5-carboxylate reductase
MAEAMIKGLLRENLVEPGQLMAAGPRADRGTVLVERYAILTTTDNREAVRDRDIVVLSVKPQVISTVLPELRAAVLPDALVLSIAAGVTIQKIVTGLSHAAVVRAMPNTPAQIGMGITGLDGYFGSHSGTA